MKKRPTHRYSGAFGIPTPRCTFPLSPLLLVLFAGCQVEIPEAEPDVLPQPEFEEIATAAAPEAIGPYSQAIRTDHALYLSGQIGLDPETGELVEGGIEAETHQVMENLGAVLEAAGMDFGHVVQAQVFLADLDDFSVMNEIYAGYLEAPHPARATIEAARLPRDARVEIVMTAAERP
jgi:2-iminobutanoate/2-iminopropanoate deaminase